MPRKPKAVAAPEPCPACDGSGETEQKVTRSRRTIRGQLGICLTCFGDGTAQTNPANTTPQP
jgi:DnaJ-class molecular chaperone